MSLSLKQLQQAFVDELSGKPNDAFRSLVFDNKLAGKMAKARRIDIYQRNHIGARASGLGNVYAVCQQILGEELFYRLACDFVATFDSTDWDLNFHGGDFNQFMDQQCRTREGLQELFYLADLARLEWLFHISYFANVNPPCTVQSQDPDDLHFQPDTSLQLFTSELPVFQVWSNNRNDKGEQVVEDNQPVYYHVVFRQQYFPKVYNLDAAQFVLLEDCIKGKTLSELAQIHGETVAANIPLFIESHWLLLTS
jgi:hypothetical protein